MVSSKRKSEDGPNTSPRKKTQVEDDYEQLLHKQHLDIDKGMEQLMRDHGTKQKKNPLSVRDKSPKRLSNLLEEYGLYKRIRSPTTLFRAIIIALRLTLIQSDLDRLEPVGEQVQLESKEHIQQLTRRIKRSIRVIGYENFGEASTRWTLTWSEYKAETPIHPALYLVQEGTGYVPLQWKKDKEGITVGGNTYNPFDLCRKEGVLMEDGEWRLRLTKEHDNYRLEKIFRNGGNGIFIRDYRKDDPDIRCLSQSEDIQKEEASSHDMMPSAEELRDDTDETTIQLWLQKLSDVVKQATGEANANQRAMLIDTLKRLQEAESLCHKQKVAVMGPPGYGKSTLMNAIIHSGINEARRREYEDEYKSQKVKGTRVEVTGGLPVTEEVEEYMSEKEMFGQGEAGEPEWNERRLDKDARFIIPSGTLSRTTAISTECHYSKIPKVKIEYQSMDWVVEVMKKFEQAKDSEEWDSINTSLIQMMCSITGLTEEQLEETKEPQIPAFFRDKLGKTMTFFVMEPTLDDSVKMMRSKMLQFTVGPWSCWGLVAKVEIHLPSNILKNIILCDTPGCEPKPSDKKIDRLEFINSNLIDTLNDSSITLAINVCSKASIITDVQDVMESARMLHKIQEKGLMLINYLPLDRIAADQREDVAEDWKQDDVMRGIFRRITKEKEQLDEMRERVVQVSTFVLMKDQSPPLRHLIEQISAITSNIQMERTRECYLCFAEQTENVIRLTSPSGIIVGKNKGEVQKKLNLMKDNFHVFVRQRKEQYKLDLKKSGQTIYSREFMDRFQQILTENHYLDARSRYLGRDLTSKNPEDTFLGLTLTRPALRYAEELIARSKKEARGIIYQMRASLDVVRSFTPVNKSQEDITALSQSMEQSDRDMNESLKRLQSLDDLMRDVRAKVKGDLKVLFELVLKKKTTKHRVSHLNKNYDYNQWIEFVKRRMTERVYSTLDGLYDLLEHNVSNYVEKLTKGVEEMKGAATVQSAVRYLQGTLLRSGKQEELLRAHLEVTEEEVTMSSRAPSSQSKKREKKKEETKEDEREEESGEERGKEEEESGEEEERKKVFCGECQREIREGEKYIKNSYKTNTPRCQTCYQRPYKEIYTQKKKAKREKKQKKQKRR